ncbi:hypothetical protein [Subtercola vilae]|nr:hypothetical protein [Subtercola vilae]
MSNTEAMDYLRDVVSLTPEIGAAMFVDDGTDVSAAIHTLLHTRSAARAPRDPANEESTT